MATAKRALPAIRPICVLGDVRKQGRNNSHTNTTTRHVDTVFQLPRVVNNINNRKYIKSPLAKNHSALNYEMLLGCVMTHTFAALNGVSSFPFRFPSTPLISVSGHVEVVVFRLLSSIPWNSKNPHTIV